jgi:hypothetical protein
MSCFRVKMAMFLSMCCQIGHLPLPEPLVFLRCSMMGGAAQSKAKEKGASGLRPMPPDPFRD